MPITTVRLPDPRTARSGDDFKVSVDYESNLAENGTLRLSYLGNYDGTPTEVELSPDKNSVTFDMTITRTDHAVNHDYCEIVFKFQNADFEFMEIT